MKSGAVFFLAALLTVGAAHAGSGYLPPEGFVPDQKMAVRIAVAVWSPIYGERKIARQKPYKAELRGGVWHVHGSISRFLHGGVAEIEIDQKSGKILRVWHGK
jgi:hypothetical protein